MHIVWNETLRTAPDAFISLRKPGLVLDAVSYKDTDVIWPAAPVTQQELYSAHDRAYVDSVLDGRSRTGFGAMVSTAVALPHVLAANGVMIEAARVARLNPGSPVMAPVSGFHHAHHGHGYGYCTFNGLILAALAVREGLNPAPPVLIIDGDAHYGDGTENILTVLRGPRTAGIHNLSLQPGSWRSAIRGALTSRRWGLVIYQAGADAHEDDDYGCGYLTDDEWRERDEMVFTTAAELKLPIVWNLAGGYNVDRVVELHSLTARAARSAHAIAQRAAHLASAGVLQPRDELAS